MTMINSDTDPNQPIEYNSSVEDVHDEETLVSKTGIRTPSSAPRKRESRRNFLQDAAKRSLVQTPVANEDLDMETNELASIEEIEALVARFARIKDSIFNDDL